MTTFSRAVELANAGHVLEAEAVCEHLLVARADDADSRALLAELTLASGRISNAVRHLSELIRLRPEDAAAHRRLGGALLSLDLTGEAIDTLTRALALEPDNIRAHNNLGQAHLRANQFQLAIAHFEHALALAPNYAIGHANLGQAMMAVGDPRAAKSELQRAVELEPGLAPAWLNLAVALERCGQPMEALAAHEHIAEAFASQRSAASLTRHAELLLSLGRPAEALDVADAAVGVDAQSTDALATRASVLCRLNRPAEALEALTRASKLRPTSAALWCLRAIVHQQLADDEASVHCYRHACLLDPSSMTARAGLLAALIPAIPSGAGEPVAGRALLNEELGVFEQWLSRHDIADDDAWVAARQQFFYLSYEEESNKALLTRYRRASCAQLARFTRHSAIQRDHGTRPFQLGIVSAQVCDHSVFNAIVRGWLGRLDHRIATTLFNVGATHDAVTDAAYAAVDSVESGPRSARDWAGVIEDRRLDALIFPEVGIDRTTLALAGLRLAPRQYAAWGHPDTTGLPTIDCYLSANAFEPPGAETHYSERLVRLPNLGVYYEPMATAPAVIDMAKFGIRADAPVLICPGTPFKYRPGDDAVWVDIARRLGRCTIVFFGHERAELSRKLNARLSAAFAESGLDARDFLAWVPWMPQTDFLGLMRQADVFLDTLGFSGFNTMMQALECSLPCVTHEGKFMRGRLGSGILRRIGLPELVASTRAEYVDIAVRLARDATYRAAVRQRLRQLSPIAYADHRAVDALSEILLTGG